MQFVLMTQQASTIVVYTLSERSAVKQRSSSLTGLDRTGLDRSSRERSETGLDPGVLPGLQRRVHGCSTKHIDSGMH